MKTPLKTFGPNMLGQDYAIGDLHGALPAFENLLREINFDKTKDRMFSVGDLVDRGPNSLGCLELLREPWFHAVLSNHEQMMYQAFNGGRMGQYWTMNGGEWGWDSLLELKAMKRGEITEPKPEHQNLFDLVAMIDDLPFLITINNRNGRKFHILHAELPPSQSPHVTDEMLSDPETVEKLARSQSGDGDSFLWARSVWYSFYRRKMDKQKLVANVKYDGIQEAMNDDRSMIISGHTILKQPMTILGLTNIDTCAYGSCESPERRVEGAGLTCINLDTWQFYRATPDTFEAVEPITVNKVDLETDNESEGK